MTEAQSEETLKEAAEGTGVLMGSMFKPRLASENTTWPLIEPDYKELVPKQLDLISSENPCKMKVIAEKGPDPNNFNWTDCDAAIDFAHGNDMKFKFHNIFWARMYPCWPKWIEDLTPVELEEFCFNYIEQIAHRYAGKLDFIDVINEMVDATGTLPLYDSPFAAIDDFACKVFKHVREKLPQAKLAYNDFSHESLVWKSSSDKVYNWVKDLRDRDCGPDVVGFENHFFV